MGEPQHPRRLRKLPFGIQLDKWRSSPPVVERKVSRTSPVVYATGDERDPLMLGTTATTAWRIQDSGAGGIEPAWEYLHEPEQDLRKRETQKAAAQPRIDIPDALPSPLLQRDGGAQSPVRSVISSNLSSPRRSVASPARPAAKLLNIMAASKMKIRGQSSPLPGSTSLPKKEKSDVEFCKARMIELLHNPRNILAHGFNETDAKTLGLVCQHLRLEKGEVFAPAGTPCEHVAMILDGKLTAYHRKHCMDTYEAGTHVGTQCHTADDSVFTMSLMAEEDTFLALLPSQKLLSYIQDLEPAREELIMNYCFEVLFTANLELNHQCEVFDQAALLQNAYRGHIARRSFWRIRDRLESPSANVIMRAWRGHRARRWLWITAPKCAIKIQCAYRRRLASSRFQSLLELQDERLIQSVMRNDDTQKVEDNAMSIGQNGSAISRTESENQAQGGHDRLTALKRWLKAVLTRCFGRWRKWIQVLNGKMDMGQSAIKHLLHGEVYSCFRRWSVLLASYGE